MSKQVDLASFKNPEYNPGNPIKRLLWYYTNLFLFKSGWFPVYSIKRNILKLFGANIGQGVVIKPHVSIKYPWMLHIGDNTWIGEHVWIDNLSPVKIGANCCLSQGALLLCGNHDFKSSSFDLITKEIILEDGVWIGAKSIVTGGVTCLSHSVLSVQSTASTSLEANSIYRGNPAVKLKDRVIS